MDCDDCDIMSYAGKCELECVQGVFQRLWQLHDRIDWNRVSFDLRALKFAVVDGFYITATHSNSISVGSNVWLADWSNTDSNNSNNYTEPNVDLRLSFRKPFN